MATYGWLGLVAAALLTAAGLGIALFRETRARSRLEANAASDRRRWSERDRDYQTRVASAEHSRAEAESSSRLLADQFQRANFELRLRDQNLRRGDEERRLRGTQHLASVAVELSSGFPWLAKAFADLHAMEAEREARFLQTKPHPALTTAQTLREYAARTREAESQARRASYLLEYYHGLLPWLEELVGVEYQELARWLREQPPDDALDNNEDDPVERYVGPHEYRRLSPVERNQLALDRYVSGRKSSWQVGRDYELFVGSGYEAQGWKVLYNGSIERFSDFGRDLIAHKSAAWEVIQCKYWAEGKVIHEKHIFQLFGTLTAFRLDFPDRKAVGRIVCSNELSDAARKFADALGILYTESHAMGKFPRIKCNVSRASGEKIYHLPFDAMYDKTQVEPGRGERYTWTVAEAERLGFRRAWRWAGA